MVVVVVVEVLFEAEAEAEAGSNWEELALAVARCEEYVVDAGFDACCVCWA